MFTFLGILITFLLTYLLHGTLYFICTQCIVPIQTQQKYHRYFLTAQTYHRYQPIMS